MKLARGLAWLLYHIDRRHRLVALDNLRLAFPNHYSEAELDALVRAVYRHFCGLLMDIIHLPHIYSVTSRRKYFELDDGRLIDQLISGRPVFMLTAHFGNWELGGFSLGELGFSSYAIARPIDNPFLDDFLRRFRERKGQKILAKHGDFDKMKDILANAGLIATLADQDAGERGLFVDFFGRPASTHKAVALLAMNYQVPIVVLGIRKIGEPIQYRLRVEDVILPEEYDGQPVAAKAITQRFTNAVERLVRSAPEQYFWLHRRWKHQPPVRKTVRDKTKKVA